jgi:hypothetical protein
VIGKTGATGKLPAANLLGLYRANGQVMHFSVVVRETDILILSLSEQAKADPHPPPMTGIPMPKNSSKVII